MIVVGCVILIFTLMQLLVALVNNIFPPKLPAAGHSGDQLVSILIPARNEEKNIGNLLGDISEQDYENLEVIVFNDQSEDNTSEMVKQYSERDRRIRLIESDGLPEGWLGKNYACHSLAKNARGRYMLFLDADVRIGNGLIASSVTFMERHGTVLLTIFPKQIMETTGEKLTVPNMTYILLSLLPLILVRRSSWPSFAAANGQFMMFESSAYRQFEPHEKMRNNAVEDIFTARYLKKERQKIACLAGDNSIMCRMYNNYREAVYGFSKNVAAFFGNSLPVAFLYWLVTTFGFIIVLIAFSPSVFFLYLLAYMSSRVLVSRISEQSIGLNLLLVIPQQLSVGLFILRALMNRIYKEYIWKGRFIH